MTSVRGDLCGCPRRCGSAAAGSVASRKQGKRSRRVQYVIVMPHHPPKLRHDSSSLRSTYWDSGLWRLAVRFKAVRRLQFFSPHLTFSPLCVPTMPAHFLFLLASLLAERRCSRQSFLLLTSHFLFSIFRHRARQQASNDDALDFSKYRASKKCTLSVWFLAICNPDL